MCIVRIMSKWTQPFRGFALVAFVSPLVASCALFSGSSDGLQIRVDTSLADEMEMLTQRVAATVLAASTVDAVNQVRGGQTTDILVVADESVAEAAHKAGLVGTPTALASNQVVLAVRSESTAVAPGALSGARIGLCAAHEACGATGQRLLKALSWTAAKVTYYESSAALIEALKNSEIDAALIFNSEVTASGGALRQIGLPDALVAISYVHYFAAIASAAPHPSDAEEFLKSLAQTDSIAILESGGYVVP